MGMTVTVMQLLHKVVPVQALFSDIQKQVSMHANVALINHD